MTALRPNDVVRDPPVNASAFAGPALAGAGFEPARPTPEPSTLALRCRRVDSVVVAIRPLVVVEVSVREGPGVTDESNMVELVVELDPPIVVDGSTVLVVVVVVVVVVVGWWWWLRNSSREAAQGRPT